MTRDEQAPDETPGPARGNGAPFAKAAPEGGRGEVVIAGASGEAGAAAEEVARAVHELEFAVHVSLRYHARRRAWFDMLHRSSMALAAIGGSGALASLLTSAQPGGANLWAAWISFSVTVAGAGSLAFGFSDRARAANDLYRRFATLAHTIAVYGSPGTPQVRDWTGERLLIEADEPPTIAALSMLCQNAEARSRGYGDEEIYHVRWWQRLFAHLLSLPLTDWRTLKA